MLTPRRTLDPERAVYLAAALVQVGDFTTALTILESADPKGAHLEELLADEMLDPIRRTERFEQVRRRGGASRSAGA